MFQRHSGPPPSSRSSKADRLELPVGEYPCWILPGWTHGDLFAFWPDTGSQNLFVAKPTDGGTTFGPLVTIGSTIGAYQIGVPAQDNRRVLIYPIRRRIPDRNRESRLCGTDLAGGVGCSSASSEPGTNVASTCKSRIWFARSTDGRRHLGCPSPTQRPKLAQRSVFPALGRRRVRWCNVSTTKLDFLQFQVTQFSSSPGS